MLVLFDEPAAFEAGQLARHPAITEVEHKVTLRHQMRPTSSGPARCWKALFTPFERYRALRLGCM